MPKEKLTILIVDDNIHFVKRMIAILKEIDDICFIYTAHHSVQAFELLHKKPDLVLLDINLPDENGMDILKRIRSAPRNCEVIMLSNHSGDYYREECKRLGAMCFLDKTNDFELVPSVIKEFAVQNNYRFRGCTERTIAVNN